MCDFLQPVKRLLPVRIQTPPKSLVDHSNVHLQINLVFYKITLSVSEEKAAFLTEGSVYFVEVLHLDLLMTTIRSFLQASNAWKFVESPGSTLGFFVVGPIVPPIMPWPTSACAVSRSPLLWVAENGRVRPQNPPTTFPQTLNVVLSQNENYLNSLQYHHP